MFVKDPLCSIIVHSSLDYCRLLKSVLYFSQNFNRPLLLFIMFFLMVIMA